MSDPGAAAALMSASPACPLCCSQQVGPLQVVDGQRYFRCRNCMLGFLDPQQRPSLDCEHAQYRLHRNEIDDPGYRRFLSRLAEPLLQRLAPASQGLDYGCGPGPALAAMLTEQGHSTAVYDPLFAADAAVLDRQYDFVTCTEVAEHFHDPAGEFRRLRGLLRPGGWLAVMTSFQNDGQDFARWHYRRDPTHVVFYRTECFHWLAAKPERSWRCELASNDIALLQAIA